MANLRWNTRDARGDYFDLYRLKLDTVHDIGVYMIWHGGPMPRIVRVGQGDVSDRLAKHRGDPKITKYRQRGLFVTWAAVPAMQRNGVERYLAETWHPLVGDLFPNSIPISVNSPFAA